MDRYEIRVAGHVDRRRAYALGCEELRLLPCGDSLLVFAAVDQAALYGLLTRLRDAGLELIAAGRVPASAESAESAESVSCGPRTTEPSKEDSGVAD
jgi:hypothetical protein